MMKSLLISIILVFALNLYSQTPTFEWVTAGVGPYLSNGLGIEVDSEGNIFTTGTFYDTSDFGTGGNSHFLSSLGENDLFVKRLNSAGQLQWGYSTGRNYSGSCISESDVGYAIHETHDNNLVMTGIFSGNADFDFSPNDHFLSSGYQDYDPFLMKMDKNGNLIWAYNFESPQGGSGFFDLDVDANGNIFLAGNYKDSIDIDLGMGTYYPPLPPSGFKGAIIIKLDSDGNLIWGDSWTSNQHWDASFDFDTHGNSVFSGRLTSTVDVDPGPGIVNVSSVSGFPENLVAKVDGNGELEWYGTFGEWATSLCTATDSKSNVYVGGSFSGTADFDPGIGQYDMTSIAPGQDAFIIKLDSNGTFIWAKQFGGTGQNDKALGIEVDEFDNIGIKGNYSETVDFDPGPGTYNLSGFGRYFLKLNPDGEFIYAFHNEGSAEFYDYKFKNGKLYITGNFQATTDFDPGTSITALTAASGGGGNKDYYVMKLDEGWALNSPKQTRLENVILQPVPADDILRLASESKINEFWILDLSGRVVLHQQPQSTSFDILTGSLQNGLFLLKLKSGETEITKKIVISH